MTTSGSFDFSLNRDELITDALESIGVLAQSEAASAVQITHASKKLNMMIKGWQAEKAGIFLWTNQEITLFLQKDQISYEIGPNGDHASPSAVKTELAAAAASGASTISVDSATGISVGDNIGIELDGGTVQWAMVDVISGTTITPSNVLTGAAAVDNHVYTYTGQTTTLATTALTGGETAVTVATKEWIYDGDEIGILLDAGTIDWTTVNGTPTSTSVSIDDAITGAAAIANAIYIGGPKVSRPTQVIEARRVAPDDNETEMWIIGRKEYMQLAQKTSEAIPTQIYPDRQLGNMLVKVWPEPDDVQYRLKMTIKREVEDVDESTDTLDFPTHWYEALVTNLALRLAPKYGAPIHPELKQQAMMSLSAVANYDQEFDSIRIVPDYRGWARRF